jgi:CubicO group peptidase (beta-lactamase class C family)
MDASAANRALDFILGDIQADQPGACVVILKGAEVMALRCAGMADMARGIPFSSSTRARIASLSKPMAAQAVARLAAENALSFDDAIGVHVPGLPACQSGISIRHLLAMQSGLREEFALAWLAHGDGASDNHGLDQRLAILDAQMTVNFLPGERTLYANTNYTLLQRAAESVTGKPFEDLLERAILRPAGMTSAAFVRRNAQCEDGIGQGYRRAHDGFEPFEYLAESTAASGVIASMDDLIAWCRWTRADPAQDWRGIGTRIARRDGTMSGYGLGLEHKTLSGQATCGHAGALNGWAADFVVMPHLDIAVILVANRNDINWYERSREALLIAADLQPDPAATPRLFRPVVAEIAWSGEFGCPELGYSLTFSMSGEDLTYEGRRMPPQADGSFARHVGVEPFTFRPCTAFSPPDWIDVSEGDILGRFYRSSGQPEIDLDAVLGLYRCDDLPGRIAIWRRDGRLLVHAGVDWPFGKAFELKPVTGSLCRAYDCSTGAGVDLHLLWPDMAADPDRVEVTMTRLIRLPYRRTGDVAEAKRATRFTPASAIEKGVAS